MVDKKISELDLITTLSDADLMTSVSGGGNKKITGLNIRSEINYFSRVLGPPDNLLPKNSADNLVMGTGYIVVEDLYGGSIASADLNLLSTLDVTKGRILLGTKAAYHESIDELTLGSISSFITNISGFGFSNEATIINDFVKTFELNLARFNNIDASGPTLVGSRARGSLATPTLIQSGDIGLNLIALGYDGTDYEKMAEILITTDGVCSPSSMPGRILFFVTPAGSVLPAEAFRINNDKTATFLGDVDVSTGTFSLSLGTSVNEIEILIDSGASDDQLPTSLAVKTYVDDAIVIADDWTRVISTIDYLKPTIAGDELGATGDRIAGGWFTGLVAGLGIFDECRTPLLTMLDSDQDALLFITWDENDTAPRTLKLKVDGGNRILTIEGDSIINQDLSSDSIVATFAKLTIDKILIESVSSVTDVVAATGIAIVDDINIRVQSSTAGDTTVTANPAIVAGSEVQVLTIWGSDNTKTVTFTDGNGLKLDNNISITLGIDDNITFKFINSNWVETSRTIVS